MHSIPLNKLDYNKRLALHNSITQPPMYISIESYSFDTKAKTNFYVIEIGVLNSLSVNIHTISTRYSVLRNLHQKICPILRANNESVPFPGKKIFLRNSPNFIKKRAGDLQQYLSSLTKNPFIHKSNDFLDFFGIH